MSYQFIRSGSDNSGRLYYWLEVRGPTGPFQRIFRADQLRVEARAWLESYGEAVPTRYLITAAKKAPRPTGTILSSPGFVTYRSKVHFVSPATNFGPYADELTLLSESPLRDYDWSVAGHVDEWDIGIERICRGNPLLIVVIATAMAAPLLAHLGDVHPFVVLISGAPSQGKSIATQLAAAMYGGGPDQVLGRLMPANVSEKQIGPLLLSNNGGALFLDDPRQQTANQVEAARVLMQWIFNTVGGTSRLRIGGSQTENRFWTLLLATSNDTPEEITRMGGQRTDAASADRVMHLQAKRQYGVFDTVPNGVEASDHALELQAFSRKIYGVPMQAVYHRLLRELNCPEDELKLRERFIKDRSEMQDRFPLRDTSSGQARRRAHFTNSYAAACALRDLRLLPFSIGELTEAFDEMYRCSEQSSARQKSSLHEVLKAYIVDNMSDFLSLDGALPEVSDEKFRGMAGFVRHHSEDYYEVYLPPPAKNRLSLRHRFDEQEWEELASEAIVAQEHDRERVRHDVKRDVRAGGADRVYVVRSTIFSAKRLAS